MDKRKDINVYIYTHKELPYGIWDNSLYTPLQVGFADDLCTCRDNTGDNISEWNPLFLELTGLYWIWKNIHTPYKGACQYRRRLELPEDYDFEELFKDAKVLAPVPLQLGAPVLMQYSMFHNPFDIATCKKALLELYPDYAEDWEKYIVNGYTLFYSNGYIMKAEDFDAYCEWLFSVLNRTKEKLGFNSIEDVRHHVEKAIESGIINARARTDISYQMEILAFLSERLFTLYVLKNFPDKIATIPYKKYEGIRI